MNYAFAPPPYYHGNMPINSINPVDNVNRNIIPEHKNLFQTIREDIDTLEEEFKNLEILKSSNSKLQAENTQMKRLLKEYKGLEESASKLADENEKLKSIFKSQQSVSNNQNQNFDSYDDMIRELQSENKKLKDFQQTIDQKLKTEENESPQDINQLISKRDVQISSLKSQLSLEKKNNLDLEAQVKSLLSLEKQNHNLKRQLETLQKEKTIMEAGFPQNQDQNIELEELRRLLVLKDSEIEDLGNKQMEIIQEFEGKFMELMKENEKLYSMNKGINN